MWHNVKNKVQYKPRKEGNSFFHSIDWHHSYDCSNLSRLHPKYNKMSRKSSSEADFFEIFSQNRPSFLAIWQPFLRNFRSRLSARLRRTPEYFTMRVDGRKRSILETRSRPWDFAGGSKRMTTGHRKCVPYYKYVISRLRDLY